jgi:phosphoribosylaminoimidazolecarboxamide formyltransferase/IMP cyclohydrolase
VSTFGSVVAANREVDEDFVAELGDLFVECLIAPGYSPGALERLGARKNLRVVRMSGAELADQFEYRSVIGGWLRQTSDTGDPADAPGWRVVTERQPGPAELEVLRFAWQAVQPVRSNAIVFARSEAGVLFTAGIGGGQPNRVDCVRIAGERAGRKAAGSVMASDAFFPFPDGLEVAASFGITAIVQPGGSTRDRQVIDAANAAGMAMIFTGVRHFRH